MTAAAQALAAVVRLGREGRHRLPDLHDAIEAGLLGEMDKDRARFEHRDRLAAVSRRAVDDGGHAIVRREGE